MCACQVVDQGGGGGGGGHGHGVECGEVVLVGGGGGMGGGGGAGGAARLDTAIEVVRLGLLAAEGVSASSSMQ